MGGKGKKAKDAAQKKGAKDKAHKNKQSSSKKALKAEQAVARAAHAEAREQLKEYHKLRSVAEQETRDEVRQAAVKSAGAVVHGVTRTVQEAARHVSVHYEAPRPLKARSVVGAWDLHNHSVYSDGSCTVDELIEQARSAGLTRMAITDHDSLSQLSAIRARARELSFPVLAGTEVSACDPKTGHKVHILAFGLEATPDGSGPVEKLVAPTLWARSANTLWQAWVLKRQGVEFSGHYVSLDEVVEVAGQSTGVYKQHVMEALTRRPRTDPDYQFCYQCWFKGSSPANRDISYPNADDAVRAIREQGGTPVLAHPGQTDSWALIPELVGAGMLGIEAYHPDHSAVDQHLAFEAAERYGLFVTGGSDYHGKYGTPPALGTAFVCPEEAGQRVEALFAAEAGLS